MFTHSRKQSLGMFIRISGIVNKSECWFLNSFVLASGHSQAVTVGRDVSSERVERHEPKAENDITHITRACKQGLIMDHFPEWESRDWLCMGLNLELGQTRPLACAS